jgi:hypothetical protein
MHLSHVAGLVLHWLVLLCCGHGLVDTVQPRQLWLLCWHARLGNVCYLLRYVPSCLVILPGTGLQVHITAGHYATMLICITHLCALEVVADLSVMCVCVTGFPVLMIAYLGAYVHKLVPNVLSFTDFVRRRFGPVVQIYVSLLMLFNSELLRATSACRPALSMT